MVDTAYEEEWGTHPKITVDAMLLMDGKVLLIQRKDGLWAMPGGFLNPGERLIEGAARELLEETGVDLYNSDDVFNPISHRGDFYDDDPERDPRTHIVTHVFMWYRTNPDFRWMNVKGKDDAIHAEWVSPNEMQDRKFYAGHDRLIARGALQILMENFF